MKIISILLLAGSATLAQAEVFKCTDKFGKANYQSTPCRESLKEQQLLIKADPLKEQQGKDKRKAKEAEYDAIKAGQKSAENQAIAETNQQDQAEESLRQRVNAQPQMAGEQRPEGIQDLQSQK